jgi:hypothetical protein
VIGTAKCLAWFLSGRPYLHGNAERSTLRLGLTVFVTQ